MNAYKCGYCLVHLAEPGSECSVLVPAVVHEFGQSSWTVGRWRETFARGDELTDLKIKMDNEFGIQVGLMVYLFFGLHIITKLYGILYLTLFRIKI